MMDFNIKELSIQELESYFNLTSKVRDGLIMMARANNNTMSKELRVINSKYDMLHNEVLDRINKLYSDNIKEQKELLNEKIVH